MKYDFCGYATRSNVKCSDGRTIMKDAFRDDDGKKVPLVWNHDHSKASSVLGHGILENRDDGVYVYASFNDTPEGQRAKELVRHGDITALSIFANKLKETAGKVMHGVIREVSLVMAGANPEAMIDSYVAHSDGSIQMDRSQGQFYSGMDGELYHSEDNESDEEDAEELNSGSELEHAEDGSEEDEEEAARDRRRERAAARARKDSEEADEAEDAETDEDEPDEDDSEESPDEEETEEPEEEEDEKRVRHADESGEDDDETTIGDVLDTFTPDQKVVIKAIVDDAVAEAKKSMEHSDEEDTEMKKNLFEQGNQEENVLSHADEMKILEMAKDTSIGTLQKAIKSFCEDESLAHGFDSQSLTLMFPEYKDLKPGAPEMLTDDQGWISKVLAKVHKSPLTHIRVRFTDIRAIADGNRAKGYRKGTQKALTGDISAIYRTTDPQTIYIRSDLPRDDVLDIQDFDYVAYMYNIDRMNLNEELATAIMLGDGRGVSDPNKIKEDKIIPIWTDAELFTIHRAVDFDAVKTQLQGSNTNMYFGENFVYAEGFVQELLYGREDAKNVGQGDLYITPHALNKMLLARDRNGRRIYNTVEELRSALNVNSIITVEQFEGKTRTVTVEGVSKTYSLLAILYDMKNYHLGAAKGGEITHFTDFDINFNTLQSLLETRTSGMNTRPLSALVLEEEVTAGNEESNDDETT